MKYIISLSIILFSINSIAQEKWNTLKDQGANFYDVKEAFEEEWEGKEYTRGTGFTLFKRWEYFMEPRCFPSGETDISEKYISAYEKSRTKKASATKSAGNWEPIGYEEWDTQSYNPGNGRVNLVAKDPSANGTYYAGTPAGGLWKTSDNFQTWTPLTDDLPTLGVSGIVVHPTNSDIIYIGTGDGDGGDTYSNGVLKSTDGGISWNTTGLSYNLTTELRVHKLIMHPTDPETLFAATRLGLWKTTTGGEVWYEVRTGNIRDVEFKPGDPQVMYCCTNRMYKSVDGGDDFDPTGTGMPSSSNVSRITIGVSIDEPDYVYAMCVNDDGGFLGMYRSEDAAETFTERADTPNIMGYPVDGNSEGGQGWYDLALDVNPQNAENIFTGGVNVWRSINGGTNYIINAHWFYEPGMSFNYVHADIHNIQYIDGELFVCSDGGVFRSSNNGVSFEDVSEGLQISQFYRIGGYDADPDLIIGGTQDNGSNLFTGDIWTHVLGADGMEAAIHPLNPNVMYCASQNGGINGSTNGGLSWNYIAGSIDGDGNWVTPYVLHPNETGTIFVGVNEIWKSTNNGGNFFQVSDFGGNAGMRDMTICKSNPDVIYTCSSTQIFKTTDGGDNWEIVTSGLTPYSITYIDVNPEDENDVAITFSGFGDGEKVYRSADGGENWENISFNLPNIPANCASIDSDNGALYIGTDLGIYYWTPELANWQPFNDGLPNVIVNEIEVNNEQGLVTAATYGRGIWRSSQFEGITELPTANFTADRRVICTGESINFTDLSYGHEPIWQWTFDGAELTSSTDQHPTVTYNEPGFYLVSLSVQNSLGMDIVAEESYIIVQNANDEFPYQEPFAFDSNLDTYEFASDPLSGEIDWSINSNVGHNEDGCLWIANGNLDEPFEAEVFSKQFDLTGEEEVYLSFWYSYAQKHPETDDRLRFFTSNTCGESWVQREMFRGESDLNTAGNPVLDEFIPSGNGEWLLYSYPLTDSEISENFSFKFRFTNDNGNHVYIDDINLTSIDLNVNDLDQVNELTIYPNPAREEVIIQSELVKPGGAITVINNLGQVMSSIKEVLPQGNSLLKMNVSELVTGIYYVQVLDATGEILATKKLIIH